MKTAKNVPTNQENVQPAVILSDEEYRNEVIAKAYKLAEQQIMDGTASAQVITQFLKMGDGKYHYELEKLKQENRLLEEKIESLKQMRRSEEAYAEVLKAMRTYSGQDGV